MSSSTNGQDGDKSINGDGDVVVADAGRPPDDASNARNSDTRQPRSRSAVPAPADAASTAAGPSDPAGPLTRRSGSELQPHVSFLGVSPAASSAEPRNDSAVRRNGSFYSNNTSGVFMRNNSTIAAGVGGSNLPTTSPMQLLYQSFADPVSDAQALENAIRETLGHELLGRTPPASLRDVPVPATVLVTDVANAAITATPAADGGVDGNQHEAAVPCLVLGPGEQLRGCENPAECYIFRYNIRAPRGERPPSYLLDGQTGTLGTPGPVSLRAARLTTLAPTDHHLAAPGAGAPHEPKVTAAASNLVRDAPGRATRCPSRTCTSSDRPPSTAHSTLPRSPHEPAAETEEATAAAEAAAASGAGNAVRPSTCTYIHTGAFHADPVSAEDVAKEKVIVDTFNSFSSETRRLEVLEAFYIAHMHPYEQNASFTADNWDDMTQVAVPRWFDVQFNSERGYFFVTIFKRRVRVFLFSFMLRSFCLFLVWVIMFNLVPYNWFYPGGLYFDTLTTIVFAGTAGTIGARVLTIPSIVGVIWAGILWNNVPYTGRLTGGITLAMRQFISMFGLSIGLIRAGLSLNVIRFRQKFKHYITFSLLPMSMEMLVHGICCKFINGFPNYRWAFAEGFLLSSIAPSVVVPVIISFQRKGYGVRDGPSMMMLCSIAVDTAMCVWGTEFLLALEFKKMSTALLIVLAPVQVIVGLVGGALLGALVFVVTFYILFMEGERLPSVRNDRLLTLRHSVHVRYLSICFMVLVAFAAISIGKRFSCLGGSAIGVVTIAGTFNYLCVRGGTADHLRVKADMAQTLTTVWDYIAMPSLFGLSGAAVNVHELFSRSFIGQAFGLVFIGIGARSLTAMAVPTITRLRLAWSEILFCGIGWIGKGSVQGALGSLAQTYAMAELAVATTPEQIAVAQQRVEWGRKMKNTAILGILVACPLCSIFLTRFTDRLLKPGT